MKHASAAALRQLESLIGELRQLPGLSERKSGIFYRGSKAFLHFHEDASGLFADAKLDGSVFERFTVSTAEGKRRLARAVRAALATPPNPEGSAQSHGRKQR